MDVVDARRLERARAHGACDYPELGLAPPVPARGEAVVCTAQAQGRVRFAAMGLGRPVSDTELAALEAEHSGYGRRELTVCPLAHPSLLERATERGYRLVEHEDILYGRPDDPGGEDEGIALERLGGEDAALWASTIALAVGVPSWAEPDRLALHREVLSRPDVEVWLARVDGEPAGGGALLHREGVATLFCTGTVPAHRGRGVHRALLRVRCASARASGVELVMAVEPGSVSERNLERYGFRLAYTAAVLASP